MSEEKAYKVFKIENGTVLDHIPNGAALKVLDILKLGGEGIVTLGMNLDSKQMGKKDLIKIENKELTEEEANKVAIIAPSTTVNIIKNSERTDKFQLTVPDELVGIIKCSNPKCVTNAEYTDHKFHVVNKEKIKVKCHYCERVMEKEDIKLL